MTNPFVEKNENLVHRNLPEGAIGTPADSAAGPATPDQRLIERLIPALLKTNLIPALLKTKWFTFLAQHCAESLLLEGGAIQGSPNRQQKGAPKMAKT